MRKIQLLRAKLTRIFLPVPLRIALFPPAQLKKESVAAAAASENIQSPSSSLDALWEGAQVQKIVWQHQPHFVHPPIFNISTLLQL